MSNSRCDNPIVENHKKIHVPDFFREMTISFDVFSQKNPRNIIPNDVKLDNSNDSKITISNR